MIIPATWNLPASLKNRLSATTYGRQRAIVEEGHLLLVLHKPPGADDSGREGVLFWRNPEGQWLWTRGSGAQAVKTHVQSYAELEASFGDQYEEASGVEPLFDLLEKLTPLTRAARNMHAALQTAREAIKNDPFILEVRDLAYEVERNLELLLEDVKNAIQYRMAREAEEQAKLTREAVRASHRLNSMAALFFPLTALASIFGMTLAHGMDEKNPAIFWLVAVIGVALGFAMRSWVTAEPKK